MQLPAEWKTLLGTGSTLTAYENVRVAIQQKRYAGVCIYPAAEQVFAAFKKLTPAQVRVIILGQDPYHQPGQAHGFAFSVPEGVRPPPSLKNIYKALKVDYPDFEIPQHGCLLPWAEQGVLLLNSVLTVEQSKAGSHQGLGWEVVTQALLHALTQDNSPKVVIAWGNHAIERVKEIDIQTNLVLTGVHPSPLSAYRGFFKQAHFKQCNEQLKAWGTKPIHWHLPLNDES